jgi:hypothetical protein
MIADLNLRRLTWVLEALVPIRTWLPITWRVQKLPILSLFGSAIRENMIQ